MNYLNITKYIYLVVGFVMLYDAIANWNNEPKPWLSVILAGLAFFTFFFRSRFAKKFEDRKNQDKPNNT
jgi:hypothetical protein